jgi:hypothetical protein
MSLSLQFILFVFLISFYQPPEIAHDDDDPVPPMLRIHTHRLLNLVQRFMQYQLLHRVVLTGLPGENVLSQLNDHIFQHCTEKGLVLSRRPSFGLTPTSSTPRLEYSDLPWGILQAKRKSTWGHGSALAPAEAHTRDITLAFITNIVQGIRNPIGDVERGLLMCCTFCLLLLISPSELILSLPQSLSLEKYVAHCLETQCIFDTRALH